MSVDLGAVQPLRELQHALTKTDQQTLQRAKLAHLKRTAVPDISTIVIHTPTPQPFYGPFLRDHPGEPVPEENFWTLWCKERLRQADTQTTRLGATLSGLTTAHLDHPPPFFTGWMPFLLPNKQCQSTEVN